MKKFLGITWHEWLCILVAVIVAEHTIFYFQLTGITRFIVFIIAWSLGFTLCHLLIKLITTWKEKN